MARLLVVDDKDSIRVVLETQLARLGHDVELAGDVETAARALAASDFDVIITDLKLGRGTGLDVVREAKKARPATEVVVMTDYATDESQLQAMRLGAYGYIAKSPDLTAEVVEFVARALEKRESARRG